MSNYKLITNYKLANIAFQKIVDPVQAYQRIEMFINNELANQIDGLQIPETDKDKVHRHGFDPTYGFRKRKT